MQRCSICSQDKDIKEFYVRNDRKENGKYYKYVRRECKKCIQKRSSADYHNNKISRRKTRDKWHRDIWMPRYRQKLYGLSPQQYSQMVKNQCEKCAICDEPCTSFNVDHCHTTGSVRALLCQACNLGLGNFKDKIQNLESAIRYLMKHSGQSVNKMAQKGEE